MAAEGACYGFTSMGEGVWSISGKTVALESTDGSISSRLTLADTFA
ncbi:hypothetical protein [Hafnia sp. HMSC23F03]|nr:hypothetical protein [Hafnia sp. HMSC23F03]